MSAAPECATDCPALPHAPAHGRIRGTTDFTIDLRKRLGEPARDFALAPRLRPERTRTRPARGASVGRADFSGFSHARRSIWQIWSAVNRGGVPGRGRSSKRSATLKSSKAIGCKVSHRWRHSRTVSTEVFKRSATWAWFWPVVASRIIRARRAICWGIECRWIKCCRPLRSVSLKTMVGGCGPGMSAPINSADAAFSRISGAISAAMY